MLGRDLVEVFSSKHDVLPFDVEDFDIRDSMSAKNALSATDCDFIIHSAAFTDVDGCEKKQKTAFQVNSSGAGVIAEIASQKKIPILYFSTDYVFDGMKDESYSEEDCACPINVYGESKLAGEKAVQEMNKKHYIIRTSWLYGSKGKNFVTTIAKKHFNCETLKVVNDQIGSPTWTLDLATILADFVAADLPYGVYNITNSGKCTWFDFAGAVVDILGGKKEKIVPISSDELKRSARRPKNSVLSNNKLAQSGVRPLRLWNEALADFINKSGVKK